MKIGVLSDTHGFLDPKIKTLFADVGHILHAGDIGDPMIELELNFIAPVTVVLGNTDLGLSFKETEVVELAARKFLVASHRQPARAGGQIEGADRTRTAGRRHLRPHAQALLRDDWRDFIFQSRLFRQAEARHGTQRGHFSLRRKRNPARIYFAVI